MHGWRVASHRRRREYWAQLIAELEAGASVEDVARRHRVKEGTLKWWRTQIRREIREGGRLLPVVQRADAGAVRARKRGARPQSRFELDRSVCTSSLERMSGTW